MTNNYDKRRAGIKRRAREDAEIGRYHRYLRSDDSNFYDVVYRDWVKMTPEERTARRHRDEAYDAAFNAAIASGSTQAEARDAAGAAIETL